MDPDEVKVPTAPYYWFDPATNTTNGGLPLKKCKTQADGVASPTALYFRLWHKEANTRLIVSQLAAIQFRQLNTALKFVHMKGGIVFY